MTQLASRVCSFNHEDLVASRPSLRDGARGSEIGFAEEDRGRSRRYRNRPLSAILRPWETMKTFT